MNQPARTKLSDVLTYATTLRADEKHPVVVFDLDHTLFDNGPRTWHILAEFAEHTGNADLRERLNKLSRVGLPYLMKDTFERIDVNDPQLHDDALQFWLKRFFTDDYQRYDLPLRGAVDFAQRAFAAGCTLIYLTGRDAPGMLVGCAASLRQHGFPVGVARSTMLLKPDFETPDLEFKTEAVQWISTLGEVVASFDNEPANCNLFQETWPAATTYFVNTAHAPNPPVVNTGVVTIDDFAE